MFTTHAVIWMLLVVFGLSAWLYKEYGGYKGSFYATLLIGFYLSCWGVVLSIVALVIKLFINLLGL